MDEKYFQESAPNFSWVTNIFRNWPLIFMGEKYFQEMAPIFLEALSFWARCRRRFFFSRNMAPHIFGSPELLGTLPQALSFVRKMPPPPYVDMFSG